VGRMKSGIRDLTGLIVGKLTVVSPSSRRGKNGSCYWVCQCSCGNQVEIQSQRLTYSGRKTSSCGCSRIAPLEGKTFGRLTVLERASKVGGRDTFWKCMCSCGNEVVVSTSHLKASTASCGCLQRDCVRDYFRHYRKSSGRDENTLLTSIDEQLRGVIKSSGVKRKVLLRDGFKCQICGDHYNLRVHHIIPLSKDNTKAILMSNLITLCHYCHKISAHDGHNHKLNPFVQKFFISITTKEKL
jgi:5-methylcytosine-specific restriction endonuclease McrA